MIFFSHFLAFSFAFSFYSSLNLALSSCYPIKSVNKGGAHIFLLGFSFYIFSSYKKHINTVSMAIP